jgi:hypothetical protein
LLQLIGLAGFKTTALFVAGDREAVLEQSYAATHQHALKVGRPAHEFQLFVRLAEIHYPFDTGAVVPGPGEEDHFPIRRQML